MRTRVMFWIPALLVTGGIALGTIQIKERVATGTGRNRAEAVNEGLLEAVRQVRGVKVAEEVMTRLEARDSSVTEELIKDVRTWTNGVVDHYEILASRRTEDGSWEADLRVGVAFVVPSFDPNRPALAIMPIRAQRGLVSDRGLDPSEIARQITERLTARIVQSQCFTVLDRQYGAEFESERNLLFSNDVRPRELARLGERLGVDYLLVGTVSEVHSSSTPIVGERAGIVKNEVVLSLDVRVADFATQQIRWAESVTVKLTRLDRESAPARGSSRRPPQGAAYSGPAADLANAAAFRLNQRLLDTLRPVCVLNVAQDTINLNQGRARLAVGEQLSVLGPAREIVDSGSGARIKVDGPEVAKVEVTQVLEQYPTVRVLSGDAKTIAGGFVCRRLPCPKCGGAGIMMCDRCDRKGEVITGVRSVENRCTVCKKVPGRMMCPECNGTGRIRTGGKRVVCSKCNGARQVTCENCGGTGKTSSDEYVYGLCKVCGGSKIVTCPLCQNGQ